MGTKKVDVLVLGDIYQSSGGKGIDTRYKKGIEYSVSQKFYQEHQAQLKLVEKKKGTQSGDAEEPSGDTEGGED